MIFLQGIQTFNSNKQSKYAIDNIHNCEEENESLIVIEQTTFSVK